MAAGGKALANTLGYQKKHSGYLPELSWFCLATGTALLGYARLNVNNVILETENCFMHWIA